MRWLSRLIFLVFLLALVAFTVFGIGQQHVTFEILGFKTPEADLFIYLMVSLVVGILIGWLLAGSVMFGMKLSERRERKQKLQAQNELEAVKAQAPAAE